MVVNYLLPKGDHQKISFVQLEDEGLNIASTYVSLLADLTSKDLSGLSNRSFTNTNRSMNDAQMMSSTLKQIMIWLPIGLSLVLYFVIMSLVDMPIQKNSILYAKYGTTKPMQVQ